MEDALPGFGGTRRADGVALARLAAVAAVGRALAGEVEGLDRFACLPRPSACPTKRFAWSA
jgi:hypothetical protein